MSLERLTPDEEIEATLFALEKEREENWLGLRARVERTGGRDAQLNLLWEQSQVRMNGLLERYFGQLLMQEAFENVAVVE